MTIRTFTSLLAIALAVTGCASPPAPSAAPPIAAPRADRLGFADQARFDQTLSERLELKPASLTLLPEAPMSPNAIPPRLEKWFSAVVKSGGTVKLKRLSPVVAANDPDAPSARTIFLTEIVDLAFTIFDYVQTQMLYAPARQFNVVVTYRDGDIQEIIFQKRS